MKAYCDLLGRLLAAEDELTRIDILRQLVPFISEGCVMEALCRVALETNNHHVRETVIKRLKLHPAEANRRFVKHARTGENPHRRRGALICLGLMGCTTAKEVVLEGLQARSFEVRLAASLNTGLYCDRDALDAFERFFEKNRLELCFNFIRGLSNQLKSKGRIAVRAMDQDRFEGEISATTV